MTATNSVRSPFRADSRHGDEVGPPSGHPPPDDALTNGHRRLNQSGPQPREPEIGRRTQVFDGDRFSAKQWRVEFGTADPSTYLRALDRVLSGAVFDRPVPDGAKGRAP